MAPVVVRLRNKGVAHQALCSMSGSAALRSGLA